ncbi:hypothetical protein JHD48_09680 [Sulfurimonas sp. SAG-AH-194-I05]|nr:hypothetical protein [Sulfurimonas sp. SAG-AH-194-I05]MDF1876005.1 hypothetical protein [Sulfurimonas sp. SAG-AH-194-I05]
MKSKKINIQPREEDIPVLIYNLTQMYNYPSIFTQGHWDIVLGTLTMIFKEFPEIEDYLKSYEIKDEDQKYFQQKLIDLAAVAREPLAYKAPTKRGENKMTLENLVSVVKDKLNEGSKDISIHEEKSEERTSLEGTCLVEILKSIASSKKIGEKDE